MSTTSWLDKILKTSWVRQQFCQENKDTLNFKRSMVKEVSQPYLKEEQLHKEQLCSSISHYQSLFHDSLWPIDGGGEGGVTHQRTTVTQKFSNPTPVSTKFQMTQKGPWAQNTKIWQCQKLHVIQYIQYIHQKLLNKARYKWTEFAAKVNNNSLNPFCISLFLVLAKSQARYENQNESLPMCDFWYCMLKIGLCS